MMKSLWKMKPEHRLVFLVIFWMAIAYICAFCLPVPAHDWSWLPLAFAIICALRIYGWQRQRSEFVREFHEDPPESKGDQNGIDRCSLVVNERLRTIVVRPKAARGDEEQADVDFDFVADLANKFWIPTYPEKEYVMRRLPA